MKKKTKKIKKIKKKLKLVDLGRPMVTADSRQQVISFTKVIVLPETILEESENCYHSQTFTRRTFKP